MKQLLSYTIASTCYCTLFLLVTQSSIAQDSLFQEEYIYCEYIEDCSSIAQAYFTPQGYVTYLPGREELRILKPDYSSSVLKEFEIVHYNGVLGTNVTYEPTPPKLRGQSINEGHYKIINQSSAHSYNSLLGYTCYATGFNIIDFYTDSLIMKSFHLEIDSIEFIPNEVIFSATPNSLGFGYYYVLTKPKEPSFCNENVPTDKYHLLKVNSNNKEIEEYAEVPFTQVNFFVNSEGQVFFSANGGTYRLNEDLSYEYLFPSMGSMYQYGGQVLIRHADGFTVYDNSLTIIISEIDYPAFPYEIDVKENEIYIYNDYRITKLDENFNETVWFEQANFDQELPWVSGLVNNNDYTYLHGYINGALYIAMIGEQSESLSCEAIDNCSLLTTSDIRPEIMKAEFDIGGFGSSSYGYFDLSLDVELDLYSSTPYVFEDLRLNTYNTSFANYSPSYKGTSYIGDVEIGPDGITTVQAKVNFESGAQPHYEIPYAVDILIGVDYYLLLELEYTNSTTGTKCTEMFQVVSKQEILNYLDQDCDGSLYLEDCNDLDSLINPYAIDIEGNGIDENCDGGDGEFIQTLYLPEVAEYTIYPNPVTEYFSINTELSTIYYRVHDSSGVLVQDGTYRDRIDISELPTGYYMLYIKSVDLEEPVVRKILKFKSP